MTRVAESCNYRTHRCSVTLIDYELVQTLIRVVDSFCSYFDRQYQIAER